MNKGFTLIELLVVVLIIGILAAIALPQYTKAVERSRMSEAVQKLGDLAAAQQIYYMQNNNFADGLNAGSGVTRALNNGDISIPAPDSNWSLSNFDTGTAGQVEMTMIRAGGLYNRSRLRITVHNNGQIDKACNPCSSANADFCTMAGAAGYNASYSSGCI